MNAKRIDKRQAKKMSRYMATDSIGFPSISTTASANEKTKRRILLQRNNQFGQRHNVPAPGHEYDFRRTPDHGRATPRRLINGQIRPCIPPDTIDMDNIRGQDSPTNLRHKFREKLDIGRCPTPMPSESDNAGPPLPTARSAWDNNGNTTYRTTGAVADDLHDVVEDENNVQIKTSHFPINNKPFHDRMGRRFKPSTAPLKYDVIISDVDQENNSLSPTPVSSLNLTENVLQYYFQRPVNKERRIAKWLVDCEDRKQNQLPAHLPDISASNRNVTVTCEDL